MLDFVTKNELWDLEDAGLGRLLEHPFPYHLKTIQDIICLSWLMDCRDQSIAEVGGGRSRLLPYLAQNNRCTNIEPFEGAGGGPKQEIRIPGVTNRRATVGEHSPLLADASFDVLFSISVVEHVATADLPAFFDDCARLLRTGALLVHLIDIYVADDAERNAHATARIEAYASAFGSTLHPVDPTRMANQARFSCRFASNPDNMMQQWNRSVPKLRPKREISQSCTLVLAGRRSLFGLPPSEHSP